MAPKRMVVHGHRDQARHRFPDDIYHFAVERAR